MQTKVLYVLLTVCVLAAVLLIPVVIYCALCAGDKALWRFLVLQLCLIFAAATVGGMVIGLAKKQRAARVREQLMLSDVCVHCGYCLRGTRGRPCPECGNVPSADASRASPVRGGVLCALAITAIVCFFASDAIVDTVGLGTTRRERMDANAVIKLAMLIIGGGSLGMGVQDLRRL